MTAADHEKSVMQSLHHLRQLAARQGDAEAVKALRDIGLKAARILGDLTRFPDTDETPAVFRDGVAVAKQVAGESTEWPATYHAISEIRKKAQSRIDELEVGSLLGIRLVGRARGFDYHSQTGFALDVFNQIEAIRLAPDDYFHITKNHPELLEDGILTESQMRFTWQNFAAMLPPLSRDSLSLWVPVGVELCRDDCQSEWDHFPWPQCVRSIIGKPKDKDGGLHKVESVITSVISKGLEKLIP